MAWTDPRTWVTSEVVTAAQLNAHVRDNLNFLYDAQAGELFNTYNQASNNFALVANQAHLMKMFVAREIAVTAVRWLVGTSSGNIDVGIYDSSLTRVWSRGSVACPSAGAASISISAGSPTSLTLAPAIYWWAIAADNGTATFAGVNSEVSGLLSTKTTSFPLPSSISSPSTPTNATAVLGFIAS